MSGAPIGVFGSAGGSRAVASVIPDQLPIEPRHLAGDPRSASGRAQPVPVIPTPARAAVCPTIPSWLRAFGAGRGTRVGEMISVPACRSAGPKATQSCFSRAAEGSGPRVVDSGGRAGVIAHAAHGVHAGVAPPASSRTPVFRCAAGFRPTPGDQEEDHGLGSWRFLGWIRACPALFREVDVYTLIPSTTTHHLLLTGVIGFVMGEGVTLASSAETAKNDYRQLGRRGLLDDPGLPGSAHRPRVVASPRPVPLAPAARTASVQAASVLTASVVAR